MGRKSKNLSEDEFDRELQKIQDDTTLDEKYADLIALTTNKTKETTMKISNTKKIVLSTVALTLFVLFTLAGTFYAGTQYESGRNAAIKNEAAKLVEQLKSESQ